MMVRQQEQDYSQSGEQWILLDWLGRCGALRSTPRFLDLGAFDGYTGSNTRALSDQGWEGVLVEADARAFLRLQANHAGNAKMTFINAAVVGEEVPKSKGSKTRSIKVNNSLSRVARVRKFWDAGDQISTVFQNHELGERVKGHWWVGCVTPYDIALALGSEFEVVSLDVEGSDLDVVRALAPVLTHTRIVITEDIMPYGDFEPGYYERLMRAWAAHGFDEVVARTANKEDGTPCNTLLCRSDRWWENKRNWRRKRPRKGEIGPPLPWLMSAEGKAAQAQAPVEPAKEASPT